MTTAAVPGECGARPKSGAAVPETVALAQRWYPRDTWGGIVSERYRPTHSLGFRPLLLETANSGQFKREGRELAQAPGTVLPSETGFGS